MEPAGLHHCCHLFAVAVLLQLEPQSAPHHSRLQSSAPPACSQAKQRHEGLRRLRPPLHSRRSQRRHRVLPLFRHLRCPRGPVLQGPVLRLLAWRRAQRPADPPVPPPGDGRDHPTHGRPRLRGRRWQLAHPLQRLRLLPDVAPDNVRDGDNRGLAGGPPQRRRRQGGRPAPGPQLPAAGRLRVRRLPDVLLDVCAQPLCGHCD
mmetsp:Transcript_21532/g.50648  ORF Transcript_21532/g.50648 Transcript_21532/m.50648 type:complete len:204 (-) Transcript_21532:1894-2505(-)